MDKLLFNTGGLKEIVSIIKSGKRTIFNFLNAYSVYLFKNNETFRKSMLEEGNYNVPDGFPIVLFYVLKNFKRLRRIQGPNFIEYFLNQKELVSGKRHFFLGLEKDDLETLFKKFAYLNEENCSAYNPPYINGVTFDDGEIRKIVSLVNKSKADYLWIGIGNPKQEILANQIFKKVSARFLFNVGAAFDYLSGKKKKAPLIIQKLCLEWLYRLITDFKHSKNKVLKSMAAMIYMPACVEFAENGR